MVEGSILQEDITFFNTYAPNNRVSNYVRQKRIATQGEVDDSTIMVETSTPLFLKWNHEGKELVWCGVVRETLVLQDSWMSPYSGSLCRWYSLVQFLRVVI